VGTSLESSGEGLFGCKGRPVQVPLDQLEQLLPSVIDALPPVPSTPTRQGIVPASFVMVDGRPRPQGDGFYLDLPTERTLGTRVTWTWLTPDGPQEAGGSLVSGFPEDWSALSGPVTPEGQAVIGTIEVFATDVPPGHLWKPEARGFERLHTAALLP
jgi:hypothetical protein